MTKLFQRACRVIVDTIELASDKPGGALDVAFNITRTLKTEPNTCELKIWNLSRSHRAQLERLGSVPVQVEAGYIDGMSLLFLGFLQIIRTTSEGPNLITTIASGDGDKAKTKRVNVTVGKGIPNDKAFLQIVQAMGLAQGNAQEILASPAVKSKGLFFKYGTVLSGQATREMDLLAESFGLEWSIQNGAVQLLQKKKALSTVAIDMSPQTGMIGSPSIDNKGILSGKCLLIPDIFPGRSIKVTSQHVNGLFRLEKCNYNGDTSGESWECAFEASQYG